MEIHKLKGTFQAVNLWGPEWADAIRLPGRPWQPDGHGKRTVHRTAPGWRAGEHSTATGWLADGALAVFQLCGGEELRHGGSQPASTGDEAALLKGRNQIFDVVALSPSLFFCTSYYKVAVHCVLLQQYSSSIVSSI